MQSGGMPKDNC